MGKGSAALALPSPLPTSPWACVARDLDVCHTTRPVTKPATAKIPTSSLRCIRRFSCSCGARADGNDVAHTGHGRGRTLMPNDAAWETCAIFGCSERTTGPSHDVWRPDPMWDVAFDQLKTPDGL